MSDDEIKMTTNIQLTNTEGQPITVKTPQPEYLTETFSYDGIKRSEIITGDKE